LACSSALPTPRAPVTYEMIDVGGGITLDVAIAGTGKTPMVLFHGYPETSWLWRSLIDPLLTDTSLKLIMPNQRGYNHSSKPKGISSYNISLLVADAVGLINVVAEGQKAHIVGHDWGGMMVAWCVAGLHPELISTLSILNSPHPAVFDYLIRHDPTQQLQSSYQLFFDTKAADRMMPALGFKNESWYHEEQDGAALKSAWQVAGSHDSALNWYRANIFAGRLNVKNFTPDMPTGLGNYTNMKVLVPTLVLWSSNDPYFDAQSNLLGLPSFVPKLTIKTRGYEGAGHWIAQEEPELVAMDIKAFISQVGPAPTPPVPPKPTIEEFTLVTEPIHLNPGQVHNQPVRPMPLPEWVVKKYANRRMGVVSFQLDVVRQENDKLVRVPLSEVYNHHTIQIMGTKSLTDLLHEAWKHKDPLGPPGQALSGVPKPHCGSADVVAAQNAAGKQPETEYWMGPVGGAEYRDADRDLSGSYRQMVKSPQAFLPIIHFINVKDKGGEKLAECPCTSARHINVANGTVDGVKPLAFHCQGQLLRERNRACSLDRYIGGYRCCENEVFVTEHPKTHGPKLTVYGQFTIRFSDITPWTFKAVHAMVDVTGHNAEYDVPKCKGKDCVHVVTHVADVWQGMQQPHLTLPWDHLELLTARGHQHVGGIGMELYNNRTGELLCKSQPRYGEGSEAGYLVGIPPCVWGSPPLRPPPQLQRGDLVRIVSRYDSTEEHLGVMGFWFMQVAIRSPFDAPMVASPIVHV